VTKKPALVRDRAAGKEPRNQAPAHGVRRALSGRQSVKKRVATWAMA
jgi:hypothetical protein